MSNGFVNVTNLSSQKALNHSYSADGTGTEIQPSRIGLVIAFYVMIVLSLVGNTVVIKAIRRIGKNLRRPVHFLFIINLSVADLLFALEMTPMICVHLLLGGAWHIRGQFGEFLCRFDVFLSAVLILTSNLTISAIAVEMFLGIFFPLKALLSKKRAYFIIAATWFVSGCYSSPLFSFAHLKAHGIGDVICFVGIKNEEVVQWFTFQTVLLAAGFVITLALYSAIGIKLWLLKSPGFHFHQLSLHFGFYDKLTPYYSNISAFLMLCNGTVNPVIYSAYNTDIRDEFKSLITCKPPPERLRSLIAFYTRAIGKKKFKDLEARSPNQQFPMDGLPRRISGQSTKVKPIVGEKNLTCSFEDTRL
ncbi:melanin-concentrating hormone receptor 1-like isoform X2 [Pocillopora damicornis]|uniref:melanin-concentrating hormone receptor 1-like isoform X2 n=1 Tax=Pocillopora damicornis TaxID=46731 RepID=UPI000F54E01A|nr:melanin-concentrating hormone receptor 1-like isoform X2 [Pocillopora damicornis]